MPVYDLRPPSVEPAKKPEKSWGDTFADFIFPGISGWDAEQKDIPVWDSTVPIQSQKAINLQTSLAPGQAERRLERAQESGWDGSTWSGAFGGFIASAASSVPELFGAPVTAEAQAYRMNNPWLGFGSQFVGPVGVYGAVYKASKAPKLANALEKSTEWGLGRLGLAADSAPIRAGMMKEFIRYTPLELTRIGTGMTFWPDNYGNMLADVGISTIATTAMGGLGGWLRTAGTAAGGSLKKVAEADIGTMPTWELRMAREGSKLTPEAAADPGKFKFDLMNEVLTSTPKPKKVKGEVNVKPDVADYFYNLEAGTPEVEGVLKTFFKPSGSKATVEGIAKKGIHTRLVSAVDNSMLNVSQAEQQGLLKSLGFGDLEELAATTVYPRVVTVTSGRSAGNLGKTFADDALTQIGPDTLLAKETDGLWLILKRTGRDMNLTKPAAEAAEGAAKGKAPRQFGPMKVAEGDQFFVAKTDQPNKFLPKEHAVAEQTVKTWNKLRDPYKQGLRNDPFNVNTDATLQIMSPNDWRAMATLKKPVMLERIVQNMTDKVKAAGGLADNAQIRKAAEAAYDVLAPTAFKEARNPVYARLYGVLKSNMTFADDIANKVMNGVMRISQTPARTLRNGAGRTAENFNGYRPVRELWADLDDAERALVLNAAISQTPASEFKALSASGQVSPKAVAAVEELQRVNKDVLDRYVIPALESAGVAQDFKWLDGYILPKVWKGDFFVDVVEKAGKNGSKEVVRWRASGATPAAAQREAAAIIDEAAVQGKAYTQKKFATFSDRYAKMDDDGLLQISDMVEHAIDADKGLQQIVRNAMRKLDAERAAGQPGGSIPARKPGFSKERTGLKGGDGKPNSLEEVIRQTEGHYRQMLRFAAYQTWQKRWYPELMRWGKDGYEVMQKDIQRKASQYMGIEGPTTRWINDRLKVLEPILGSKPGTSFAQGANKLMYNWNLAILNPTFAVLNLLTPLQTVAPWISYMQKAPTAFSEKIMQMHLIGDGAGKVKGSYGALSPLKIIAQSVKMMKSKDPVIKEVFERALNDGTFSPQLYENFVGGTSHLGRTMREAYQQDGGMKMLYELSTYMATKSEQFSRLSAFNSAYIVGRDVFGLADDALYRFAKKGTDVTMYGYGVTDRARIFTGPAGSMFGLFKNWQMHFVGQMVDYAELATKEKIFAPMLWQSGAASALGGLGATPLRYAADGLANMYTESPTAFHWLQNNWQEEADPIYFGLPAFLGASLQASSMMPGTDVRNDLSNLGNIVIWERMKLLGGAVGEAIAYESASGNSALANPNIRDQLFGATMPRFATRIAASVEGDYVKSMRTGLPQVQELGFSTKLLYALGLNQTDVDRYQVAGNELWKDKEKRSAMLKGMGQDYAMAYEAGDSDEMTRLVEVAMMVGVPVDSMIRSAHTRNAREEGDLLMKFDDQAVQGYLGALGR